MAEPSTNKTRYLALDYKIAGALCYIPIPPLNLLACLFWIATEPQSNSFLRFHAMQGLLLFIIFIAVGAVSSVTALLFAIIPFLGLLSTLTNLFWLIIVIAYFVASIMWMISTYKEQMNNIPYLGDVINTMVSGK